MRVIAGKYKGRVLSSPKRDGVRPTTDMVKQSLFSVLESRGLIEDAVCLDVFSGSGALGIEALSRGATSCTFIDKITHDTMTNLSKIGLSSRVMGGDFRRALKKLSGEHFDLIFCDPPYMSGYYDDFLSLVQEFDLLYQDGVIILEHSSKNDLINLPENCIMVHRAFGESAFTIIKRGNYDGSLSGNV